jgi:hypothetical protein
VKLIREAEADLGDLIEDGWVRMPAMCREGHIGQTGHGPIGRFLFWSWFGCAEGSSIATSTWQIGPKPPVAILSAPGGAVRL